MRPIAKNKIFLVITCLIFLAFLVREKIFIGKIRKLLAEAASENVEVEQSSENSTNSTTPQPWISSTKQVRLWMDIPNAFPWRHCIEEYNNVVTLLRCFKVRFLTHK